jgi:hypothetical protein
MGDNKTRGPQQQQNDPQRQSPGQQQQQGDRNRQNEQGRNPGGQADQKRTSSAANADEDRSVNVKEGPAISAGPFFR